MIIFNDLPRPLSCGTLLRLNYLTELELLPNPKYYLVAENEPHVTYPSCISKQYRLIGIDNKTSTCYVLEDSIYQQIRSGKLTVIAIPYDRFYQKT